MSTCAVCLSFCRQETVGERRDSTVIELLTEFRTPKLKLQSNGKKCQVQKVRFAVVPNIQLFSDLEKVKAFDHDNNGCKIIGLPVQIQFKMHFFRMTTTQ